MTPEEVNVIRRARAVLLDFDGPVCDAFAGYPAPQVAQDMLAHSREAGVPISEEASAETDPMEVLRYLFKVAPERHSESERVLQEAEVLSVAEASPTPGAIEFMEACKETERPLMVVSNNSPEAVETFLKRHEIEPLVSGIFGRPRVSPELMKPNPHLLELALKEMGTPPSDGLMIGDSATDIQASKKLGIPSVGYANNPGKAEKFQKLESEAIIEDMREMVIHIKP